MSVVSRRQLAKGAAWSVPVVAVAVAAPAASASPASFDLAVAGGCLPTGDMFGSVFAYFELTATSSVPVPAGRNFVLQQTIPGRASNLTVGSIMTDLNGGTDGIANVSVSADASQATFVTTRDITAAGSMRIYVYKILGTQGESTALAMAGDDANTANNAAAVVRTFEDPDAVCYLS
ncbi:hypothetical protein [Flexivirga sp. B27]